VEVEGEKDPSQAKRMTQKRGIRGGAPTFKNSFQQRTGGQYEGARELARERRCIGK